MSRWFRFYADAMENPKVLRLSDSDFRFWVRLLSIASKNDGKIPNDDDLKLMLGVRLDHLKGGLKRLLSGGLIDASEDGYEPHNWSKFQYKSDTSNERVARHRAKRNVTVTPPDTDTEQSVDVDDDARAENAPSDAIDLTAEVCRLAGIRHIDPGHIVSRVPVIREWLQAGADPPLILATVRDLTAATNDPIRSLNFIDPHIRKAITRKENPNAQSAATGQPGRNPAQPSGRTATVLKLLAEVRANAATDQPGDHGIAGRIGHALP